MWKIYEHLRFGRYRGLCPFHFAFLYPSLHCPFAGPHRTSVWPKGTATPHDPITRGFHIFQISEWFPYFPNFWMNNRWFFQAMKPSGINWIYWPANFLRQASEYPGSPLGWSSSIVSLPSTCLCCCHCREGMATWGRRWIYPIIWLWPNGLPRILGWLILKNSFTSVVFQFSILVSHPRWLLTWDQLSNQHEKHRSVFDQ